jgi:hypothetical protein
MTQLLGLLLTLEATEDMGDVDYDALDTAIKSVIIILVAYTGMLRTHGEQIASSSTSRQRRRTLLCSSPRKRPPNQRSL